MSDYHDQEEVLKGYSSDLVRRLLTFLKPYRWVFIVSVAALLLATVGELALPILIQRAVDRHILPYHRALRLELTPADILARVDRGPGGREIEGLYFFPNTRLSDLSVREKEELRRTGALLPEEYLLVTAVEPVITGRAELFTAGEQRAAITVQDYRRLPTREQRLLRQEDTRGLAGIAVFYLIILAGVLIFSFAQVYLQAWVGQRVMRDLRVRLFDHTLGLSLSYIDRNPIGRLVTRITNDVETINELFTTVAPAFLADIGMMIGVFVALFLLSPRLALTSLITLPPVLVATLIFRNRARDAFRRVRMAVSRLNAFLSEHIAGMSIVQLFARERASREDFDRRNQHLLRANLGEMYVFATFRPLVDALATVSVAVIIYFGAGLLLRDLMSLGVLIAFITLIRRFFEPVRDISEKYSILQSAMAGGERVFALLDEDSRIPNPGKPAAPEKVMGEVVFDRVTFGYKEGEPVLRDLSFRIRPGETVAIVGYTGAGKTTITSLLTRLWDVWEGAIRVDGTDIRELSLESLRRRIQAVLQDVFLFSGTIEENIRLGADIPRERVEEVVRLVRADTFIERMPEGLASELSERGANLSMGQRQLLSFARVLAHNPDILVLDEATGNIDTETEKLIQQALKEILRGRTSLVIAHRLSTIRGADRILVLDQGRRIEEGTHDELLREGGMYARLYRLQYDTELKPEGSVRPRPGPPLEG